MNADEENLESTDVHEFPEAKVRTTSGWLQWLSQSTLPIWLITIACAGVAVYLGYRELAPEGTPIVIHFRDGRGLKAEDQVRYRGIVVGEVDRVELDSTLHGVSVHVHLIEHASPLAREGTTFWIERPEVSLGAIRGLDTLVGGNYVAVLPGPEESVAQIEFHGLEDPPADVDVTEGGLSITLVGKERHGIERGAPLSFRGMTVGRVSSVTLSPDAANVLVSAVVDKPYHGLVRSNSQFWQNGGIGMKFGMLDGFDVNIDTLRSLAVGGIAFATPTPAGDVVRSGAQFELLEEEVEDWADWGPMVDEQSDDGSSADEEKGGFFQNIRSRFGGGEEETETP